MKANLEKYALAASSVLLGANISNAMPIYTDLNPDVIVEDLSPYTLSFIGIDRFELNHYAWGGYADSFYILPITSNAAMIGSSNKVQYLAAGSTIGSTVTDWINYQTQPPNASNWNLAVSYSVGNFRGKQGFVGLKFADAGVTRYAWLQIAINSDATQMTIFDYAFESDAATAINAGQVPEPTSLGLLALGAAGLIASRKKK